MALSKEKIEQIRKDAEEYGKDWTTGSTHAAQSGYIFGATEESIKALCLIEALKEISKRYWIDRDAARIATAALQEYTNSLK